jgi:CHRD domain
MSEEFQAKYLQSSKPVGAAIRCVVAGLSVAALLAGGTTAFASQIHFTAELSGGGEAPPNPSPARGHVDATLDTDTNTLTWRVTYSGLTAAPIGAHFHGPVAYSGLTSEENAPIQVGTPGGLGSPFSGRSVIDATQTKDLKGKRWYFNLHSKNFPGGEIRGPVVEQ